MTVLLDAFAVVVLLAFFAAGVQKGFAKTFFTLLGSIGGFIAAIVYNSRLSVLVNAKFITPLLRTSTTKYLESLFGASTGADGSKYVEIEKYLNNIPDILASYLGKMGTTTESVKAAFDAAPTIESARSAAVDAIFSAFASTLSACISFALIFFGVMLACAILGGIVGAVFQLPVLKQFNRLAGGVAGLIKGVFVLVVVAFLFNTIQPALKKENVVFFNTAEMSKTQFFKYFVVYHPLANDSTKEEPAV